MTQVFYYELFTLFYWGTFFHDHGLSFKTGLLFCNWKKEFLDNASVVFDDKREDNLKEKLAEERKEKEEYAKKVGQLTMQVDWLKKIWRNLWTWLRE